VTDVAEAVDGGSSGREHSRRIDPTVNTFVLWDTHIYRPYRDEIPWELLLVADPDEERVNGYAYGEFMRVAKIDDKVVGVYVIQAVTPTRYQLRNLAVSEGYRRKGLGGWLLGHAIGIAETKGAREIYVADVPLRGLFKKIGFAANVRDLLLTLTPE
jgi:GNAT superfamily N-acetyltransferase